MALSKPPDFVTCLPFPNTMSRRACDSVCAPSDLVADISAGEQVFWIADAGCRAMTLLKPPTVGGPLRGPKHQEGLVIPSSPPLGQGVSRYDIRVVQSPSDCILRSVSPLCRLRSDVSGPAPLTPWVSVVARQTPPRPCLNQWVRMAEGRVSRLVRSPASLGSLSATREHHLAAEA